MTNDIVALIDFYEREKAITRERVVEALEYAFTSAYRRMVPGADAIEILRAEIDTKKGETKIFADLAVVEDAELTDKFNEVPLSLASKRNADAQIGDRMEFNVTPKNFGRIAVQTAKQTMMDVMIDLGKFEGRMPSRERVSTEDYNVSDRIRCYVVSVDNDVRGPEIILSRSHPAFVRRLFEAEVAEISDRTVELKAIAREAGYRTKVAVGTTDDKVDPVGACVGLRGARVKNIVRELNNEKVDIIRYSEDLQEFVTDALKPAIIRSFKADEESKVIHVTVDEEDLSKAIGRRGQNARLTSKLVGWDVQVRKDETQHEQFEARLAGAAQTLADDLELEPTIADKIFRSGGATVELVTQMPVEYLAMAVDGDEALAAEILEKAQQKFGGNTGGDTSANEAEVETTGGDSAEPEVAADADEAN